MNMKMDMKLVMNKAENVAHRHGIDKDGLAQQFFTAECARYMDPFIPFDKGYLKNNKRIGKAKIEYVQPYARRQYYEHRGDGNRGGYWDQRMWIARGKQIIQSVSMFIATKGG